MLNAEMSGYEIGRRMVMNIVGGEEADWLLRKEEIDEKISEYYRDCAPPLFEPVGTIDEVEAKIKYHAERGVSLVAVDYLQLLRCHGISGRYEAVTEISQRIKGAARDNDVALLALCQVSREVEKRDSPQFQPSDLRESGQLEQDADLIAFGWWWGRSKDKQDSRQSYELHIAKRRNGPVRQSKIKIKFDPSKQRFHW
jgi:replicative DNA helicase